MTAIEFTTKQKSEIAAQYSTGMSIRQIALIWHRRRATIRAAILDTGMSIKPRGSHRRVPQQSHADRDAKIVEAARQGKSIKDLSIEFALSRVTISKILRVAGVAATRHHNPSDSEIDRKVVDMYTSGEGFLAIITDLHVSYERIKRLLTARSIPTRPGWETRRLGKANIAYYAEEDYYD